MEVGNSNNNTMIDETYEYSAPMFFDFVLGETDEEMETAQHWFETALSYAPSPFMPRIKESRTVQIESLCDFSDVEIVKKDEGPSNKEVENSTRLPEVVAATAADKRVSIINEISVAKNTCDDNSSSQCCQEKQSFSFNNVIEKAGSSGQDACTPELQKKTQTAKKIASLIQNPSTVKPIKKINLSLFNGVASSTGSAMTTKTCSKANGVPSSARSAMTTKTCSQANCVPSSARSAMITKTLKARSAITTKKTITAPDFTQDNQAIKRQKLEGGKSREILNLKLQNLTHNKSSLGVTNVASCSTSRAHREDRKLYVREEAVPFVSTAEMVRRFQSSTRDGSVFNESTHSSIQKKSKLTLTRPKEPDFETSHRVRSTRVKSSSELEEEMMANIPKFKARPVNKKILEAPTLQALPRSTPHPPEFQEFHLKTMERASQNSETSSVVSMESSQNNNKNNVWNPHKLTEPKTPRLETLIRARPSKAKTTEELEHEELEKIPKFKARPLDKRIFESKGGMGMFRIPKGHITKPQEFHFATDERIPPTKSVMDLFDKLSLNSESRYDPLPRITTPNPFHLNTEERGAEKERKFVVEIMERRLEEERARIPKATPYPYTTDYPVVPPKPEPKHCTKPEPFQLESLVRHEEEMQREMEERQRLEREEAQMRIFKAQPILKEDPLPVPEKERKPLTQVEEFALHVDHRAQDRAEFDKKIKEKEMQYKRYREESESAKLMEEEKALKQLRRTLVPHARPVPKFDNPFQPQKSSKETTKPKSPKLRVLQRKQRRTSVSASHMR